MIFVVLSVFCGCQEKKEPLSQPQIDLPLKIEIACPTGAFEIGQPIPVSILYTNISPAPLNMVNSFEPVSPILWEARDKKNRPVEKRKKLSPYTPASETRTTQLRPGQSLGGSSDINKYFNFIDAETYSITAHYTALAEGTVSSNSCQLQVKWPE